MSKKLDVLNRMLQDTSLNIPDYRRRVDKSGANLSWLQKHITVKNPNCSVNLLNLLKKSISELLQEV